MNPDVRRGTIGALEKRTNQFPEQRSKLFMLFYKESTTLFLTFSGGQLKLQQF